MGGVDLPEKEPEEVPHDSNNARVERINGLLQGLQALVMVILSYMINIVSNTCKNVL